MKGKFLTLMENRLRSFSPQGIIKVFEIYEEEGKLDDYWIHNVFIPLFKSEQHTYQPKDLEISGSRQNDHVCQIVLSLAF